MTYMYWKIVKTIENKRISFVWLYLLINICEFRFILLDHITYFEYLLVDGGRADVHYDAAYFVYVFLFYFITSKSLC